jgi:hypothetical protein
MRWIIKNTRSKPFEPVRTRSNLFRERVRNNCRTGPNRSKILKIRTNRESILQNNNVTLSADSDPGLAEYNAVFAVSRELTIEHGSLRRVLRADP